MEKTVLLLHGFASSGKSRKAIFLSERFKSRPHITFHAIDFNPTPRDFEFVTVTGMINRLRQYILDRQLGELFLVGSSLGALVGLNYAHRFGGVQGMLLLAPALAFQETERRKFAFHYAFERDVPLREDYYVDGALYAEPVPPPRPITIVHGRHDDVIPIAHSREYVAAHPGVVELSEVDSDHRLSDQLDFIWERLSALVGTAT
jgi:pimeloyl-ACP methyl ester carboxylesterase